MAPRSRSPKRKSSKKRAVSPKRKSIKRRVVSPKQRSAKSRRPSPRRRTRSPKRSTRSTRSTRKTKSSPRRRVTSSKRKSIKRRVVSPKRRTRSPPRKIISKRRAVSSKRKTVMRGGGSNVNPTFKKLYKMLKDVPLISIPVIPQFEQGQQKAQPVEKAQKVQKLQTAGYRKDFKLKTQEDGTRKFVLYGYSYDKNVNKDLPVNNQISYVMEDKDAFGRFDNIKPQEAAKKIYSRLCKKLRKDYGEQAASCVNVLLQIQEQCCDNLTTNNKTRDYYYYMQNTPNKRVVTKKDGKTMNVYNNAKAIPIFAIRNRKNEIVRMQSVNEALDVALKKRNTSIAVYERRKNSGKKLLKNARR